ncbi:hypothetical protein IKD56_01980 [bacterium]|nr:hypothetical protein [bacterium]
MSFLALAISIKAKAINTTARTVRSQQKIEKIIEPCELFKTLPDLKNIPAPITAPITIIIEEKKLIFFFKGALANEDSLFRFSFCNAFSFVKFTYLLYLKF